MKSRTARKAHKSYRPAITSVQIIALASTDEWFHWSLKNWRHWAKLSDEVVQTRCASAEGGYQIPWWEQDPNDIAPATAPPCERAAETVERIYSMLSRSQRLAVRICIIDYPDIALRHIWEQMDDSYDPAEGDQWRAAQLKMPVAAYLDHLRMGLDYMRRALHDHIMTPLEARRAAGLPA